MVEFKKIRIILIILVSLISGCALQLPPEGGDIDLIPPEIVSTFPESGTVNYSKKFFEIEFSEYVDKRSFREALFISPTIDGEMIVDWSGKSVEVYFPNGFKENTTYVITIGSDVVDINNKNRMANAFNLYFSTGDKIDKKVISGRVFDKQADGSLLYAYIFKSDTTDYLLKKADYISQCGKDGQFSIQGLSQGTYRIFAVKDEFRDLIFQADRDLIGIPHQDIILTAEDSSYSSLYFYLTKIDTIRPRVLEVRMLEQNHIFVQFSEEINFQNLSNDFFQIVDTSEQVISEISYLFNPVNKRNELILVPKQKLNSEQEVLLTVKNVKDIYENKILEEKVRFDLTEKSDTNSIKIVKVEPADFRIDYLNPSIKIFFDDAFQKEQIEQAINFIDINSISIPIKISYLNDAAIHINPLQKLKPDSKYRLEINMNLLPDAADNVVDTIVVNNFITKSDIEFSGLSGTVISNKENLILVLESELNADNKNFFRLDSKNAFEFERIVPGNYKLWAFEDRNKNGQYDHGALNPFKFSERFYFYPQIIEIKPRWSLSDIVFLIE